MQFDRKALIRAALEGRKQSYSPYSHYQVGAALLCENGETVTGCNIENAAYSVCNCAERTALFAAVAKGIRHFRAIAVVGGKEHESLPLAGYAYPCGVCRQALHEFAPGLTVLVARSEEDWQEHSLDSLLLHGFGPRDLEK